MIFVVFNRNVSRKDAERAKFVAEIVFATE
ncbi:MAG: hypothetical protein K0S33_3861 [Bacteroidetes bacterium]|jgi:hypothetical protein|nr:hypothetical protein [Bacteroidota bacterium]